VIIAATSNDIKVGDLLRLNQTSHTIKVIAKTDTEIRLLENTCCLSVLTPEQFDAECYLLEISSSRSA
jgi:hypothetical protein